MTRWLGDVEIASPLCKSMRREATGVNVRTPMPSHTALLVCGVHSQGQNHKALFVLPKDWKQAKCPSGGNQG